MNIVIPMVGLGKRFADAGFKRPKPLIDVRGKAIVEHAIESFGINGNYIFIIRTSDFSEELKFILKTINFISNSKFVTRNYIKSFHE
jgi:choline kinase